MGGTPDSREEAAGDSQASKFEVGPCVESMIRNSEQRFTLVSTYWCELTASQRDRTDVAENHQ